MDENFFQGGCFDGHIRNFLFTDQFGDQIDITFIEKIDSTVFLLQFNHTRDIKYLFINLIAHNANLFIIIALQRLYVLDIYDAAFFDDGDPAA